MSYQERLSGKSAKRQCTKVLASLIVVFPLFGGTRMRVGQPFSYVSRTFRGHWH